MKRYHKKVYFPKGSTNQLKAFTTLLNNKKWAYSRHSLDNIRYRASHLPSVLSFISALTLDSKDIFEYYADDTGGIEKACYRLIYGDNMDLILVISKDKLIVTIYSNIAGDNHLTLKKELYQKGV